MPSPLIVCLDLEGVLVPEVWIAFAEKTGIPELRRTTRDEPDYDKLMRGRLAILDKHKFKLADIQAVIASLRPLDGATEFLHELRARTQVLILSDTFYQFAQPLMEQLSWPTLFCNDLVVSDDGRVTGYELRIRDGKRKATEALKNIGFRVHASGDSYNDTTMLLAADRGVLFRCPQNVADEFPQFPRTEDYGELMRLLLD
ncbi:MAG TPA: bifunctional phosphoserine phosphatase/homoserine phosphotransferase ThrH [Candidatus Limnocylindrales bacterium]|nr:bifunctional phosphoserine phosphatase/homoserine phosphotransferase ThrH [Candidatus Limnocylindrales bacterium]